MTRNTGFAVLALLLTLGLAQPIQAQQDDDADADDTAVQDDTSIEDGSETPGDSAITEASDEAVVDLGRVEVTGSRLLRETYTSLSPMQTIDAEASREEGLVDVATILQLSPASAGTLIDQSLGGFVTTGGPGASNVNLRGYGIERTLTLLNGLRLAPSGVEGAPVAPDLNLVPGLMVQRYELLLDGASSVYGSDAMTGVVNIITRTNFDGFEFNVSYSNPESGDADRVTANALWGRNFDRGFIGVGVEYFEATALRRRDVAGSRGCEQHVEVDENGNIRNQDLFRPVVFGMEWDQCGFTGLYGRVQVPIAGSIYYTPGYTNGGWPNFSESSTFGFGVDGNGDGMTDVSWRNYDPNGSDPDQNLMVYPDTDRLNLMSYGEYTFDGEMENTLFFEFGYNERNTFNHWTLSGPFHWVPARNPFNLCNPEAEGGVDCGLAQDALYTNPFYVDQFQGATGPLCAAFGIPLEACTPAGLDTIGREFGIPALQYLSGPIGPAATRPLVGIKGAGLDTRTEIQQMRVVLGSRGELPMLDAGPMNSWFYEAAFVWTRSDGESERSGIRGDRLDLALGWYSSTSTPCENDFGVPLADDTAPGCVPVNLFAPSLYNAPGRIGDFATAAERNYIMDIREFDTRTTQALLNAYMGGYLWDLEGGPVSVVAGLEWRNDDIRSTPDHIARDGLFYGWFTDAGANGDKDTFELFGEIEMPLLAGRKGAEELTVNASLRWTDDEFYGSDTTWSAKLGWRPVPSLLLRATAGTSFRAPNVREVFLEEQTGFQLASDPCVVPEDALDQLGNYVPELDTRAPYVLDNCRNNGVDPTTFINMGVTSYGVEMLRGGNPGLEPETSESFTYGFSWEQPFTNRFALVLGASYYDIEAKSSITQPSAAFSINDCYQDREGDSPYCRNITRGPGGRIQQIDGRFINRDLQRGRGIDINVNFGTDFDVGDRRLGLVVDVFANHSLEVSETFINDNGETVETDFVGRPGYPEWKAQIRMALDLERWRWTWTTNYIGDSAFPEELQDEFSSIYGSADTCLGPPDDVLCRNYDDLPDYWLHSTSINYTVDSWSVGLGVRNVFDEEPPKINGTTLAIVRNAPIARGYDLYGRTWFANVSWRPGSGR